jgi:glycosyltransferase
MKISVVTICHNAERWIGSAVRSVLSQSYADVEYIIVDGASSDETLAVVWDTLAQLDPAWREEPFDKGACDDTMQVGGRSVRVISEADGGLYDALNKGVRLATGEVIGFVHADDFLAHEDVLRQVAACLLESGADAVYGDLQYIKGGADEGEGATVLRYWRSGSYSHGKLRWGWMPPHPALYVKRWVYEEVVLANGDYFDRWFRCAADYDFMLRILAQELVQPVYLPEVLVKMRVGGVSNRSVRHIVRKSMEDWRAIRRNRIGHLHTLMWKNVGKIGQFFVSDR